MELLMTAAWDSRFGSSGPSVSIFTRFQAAWPELNKDYNSSMVDNVLVADLGNERLEVIAHIRHQLALRHSRDDYKELLSLSLAFLGVEPIKLKVPGAHSRARWMAKAIYCLKIWMLRDQFWMSASEKKGVSVMCLFILRVYIPSWFTAPLGLSAARNDLALAKKLIHYSAASKLKTGDVYKAAALKLASHLWYLSEELVAMAFYDPEVSIDEKKSMVDAMKNCKGSETREIRPKITSLDELLTTSLSNFVSTNTEAFFEISGLSSEFLETDPTNWETHESYQLGRRTIKSMLVVNDCAERGVALIENFCGKITKSEEQLQFLLQVVGEHRKQYPECSRATMLKNKPNC